MHVKISRIIVKGIEIAINVRFYHYNYYCCCYDYNNYVLGIL